MLSLDLNKVTKSYGAFKAVDCVTFTLLKGETIGLVGESGCGKSTVAAIMAGLIPPDNQGYTYSGRRPSELNKTEFKDYRKNVQMVFQDSSSALNPRLTAGQSIAEPIKNFMNLNKTDLEERISELMISVGLSPKDAGKRPKLFSGGQRQRICIARAIAVNPGFLLLDEVTSNLDVSVQAQMLNLLLELKNSRDMGMLFISHDLSVIRYMCERVLIMYGGRIVEVLEGKDFKDAMHPYTQLLIESVPSLGKKYRQNKSYDSTVKSLGRGCGFYNRCRLRSRECTEVAPELKDCGQGHKVACFKCQSNNKAEASL